METESRAHTGTERGELTGAAVGTLVLTVMAFAAIPFMLSPLLPDIAASFGLRPAQAGWAVAAFGVTVAVVAPAMGLLGGQLPRRLLIRVGLAVSMMGLILAALAPGFVTLLAALAVAGAGGALFLPMAYALVGDRVPFARRGRIMGFVMAGWGLSIVLLVPVGGWLAEVADWPAALTALAVLAGVALLATRLLPEPSAAPASLAGRTLPRLAAAVFLDPGARLILLVNLINMMAFYGAYTYLGTWLREAFLIGSDGAGLIIVAYGAGLTLTTLNSTHLDRFGPRRGLYLAHAGLMAGWLVVAFAPTVSVVVAGLLWIGICQGGALVGQSTLSSHQSEQGRGAVMAFFACTTYLGLFAGAALFAPIFTAVGFLAVAIGAGGLNVAASLLLHAGRRRLREG